MVKKDNKYSFYQKENDKISISKKISLSFNEFDMVFYKKDKPSDLISVKDFQNNCDSVYDKTTSVFFFICYQKVTGTFEKNYQQVKYNKKIFQLKVNPYSDSIMRYSDFYDTTYKRRRNKENDDTTVIGETLTWGFIFGIFGVFLLFCYSTVGIGFIIFGAVLILLAFIFNNVRGRNVWADKTILEKKTKMMERSFKDSYYFNKLAKKDDVFVIVNLEEDFIDAEYKEMIKEVLTGKNEGDNKKIVV